MMIRVALLSFWHVHTRDYIRQTLEHPETELVAAWDDEPERGRVQAEALGVPFYENLDDLLAQTDIDAVIVETPTNLHHKVLIAAARAGKHIFTEKVIAPTLHECNQIMAAIEQAGVKLIVSLPRLYAGYTLAVKDILAHQQLGKTTQVRVRLSHNGAIATAESPNGWLPERFFNKEQCGGGAMIDLGCHPMYLTNLFLGWPESVNASYGYVTGHEVEDNAVVTLNYPDGAIGIVEAGFVNRFSPFTIEAHGTEGSLLFGTPENKLLLRSTQTGTPGGDMWHEIAKLPSDLPLAFKQWVSHINNGTTATENIRIARELTSLMEAANISARTHQAVRLDSLER
jgi:1,5-anhydro-D-fructose reductase (1,5-anhydro-D-mannitol-forming)